MGESISGAKTLPVKTTQIVFDIDVVFAFNACDDAYVVWLDRPWAKPTPALGALIRTELNFIADLEGVLRVFGHQQILNCQGGLGRVGNCRYRGSPFRYGRDYRFVVANRSALQASAVAAVLTRGFAPRWYRARRWRLRLWLKGSSWSAGEGLVAGPSTAARRGASLRSG